MGDKVGIPGALVTAFVGTTDGASVGSVKGVGRFPISGSKLVGADEGIELGIDDCGGITGIAVGGLDETALDGAGEGRGVGAFVGELDGAGEGGGVASVGGDVGPFVGGAERAGVGAVVGSNEGAGEGASVGGDMGPFVGDGDGGELDGDDDGGTVGLDVVEGVVGSVDGDCDGTTLIETPDGCILGATNVEGDILGSYESSFDNEGLIDDWLVGVAVFTGDEVGRFVGGAEETDGEVLGWLLDTNVGLFDGASDAIDVGYDVGASESVGGWLGWIVDPEVAGLEGAAVVGEADCWALGAIDAIGVSDGTLLGAALVAGFAEGCELATGLWNGDPDGTSLGEWEDDGSTDG